MAERPERADIRITPATADDAEGILALLRETMGWDAEGLGEGFFAWKHRDNPFGRSPEWVARHDGGIVAYRTFLRWHFRDAADQLVPAVRAVDTVTHPDYQGLGLFRALTLQAVSELTVSPDRLVFNTPNDQSRAGYLKMGWSVVRRLPVGALPAGPAGIQRMVTARAAANLWSEPCELGDDAPTALADTALADALLEHAPTGGFRTARTPAYLQWRTAFAPLRYRLLLADARDPRRGGVIFRLRRRGGGTEAAIAELFVHDARSAVPLLSRMVRESGADYAIGIRGGPAAAALVPVPRQGPLLTARALSGSPPPAREWRLSLGDVELF